MRRLAYSLLLPLLLSSEAIGQTSADPKFEIFAGYSLRTIRQPVFWGFHTPPVFSYREKVHGGALGFDYNFHRHIGVTVEVAAQRRYTTTGQFFAGPRFRLRSGRVTEFVHALVGTYRRSPIYPGATDFAMGFGGGVNVRLTNRVSLRAFQADWIPVKEEYRWRHQMRFQTGIVFTFGRR